MTKLHFLCKVDMLQICFLIEYQFVDIEKSKFYEKMKKKKQVDPQIYFFFPQHLVEGLLNFRRRVCRSFWLDLAFQDPPRENGPILLIFFYPPNEIKHSSA